MRERWGTFSVRDHLEPRAFVTDAVLYDRLVVPYPNSVAEWERWETARWNPSRQDRLLSVFAREEQRTGTNLVVRIPWDEHRRARFTQKYRAAQAADYESVDGYGLTAHQLMTDEQLREIRETMPLRPKAVCAYVSRRQLKQEVSIEPATQEDSSDAQKREQELAIVLGHELLVPDDSSPQCEEQDLELLERAARLSSTDGVKQKRAAFYEWVDASVGERLTNREAMDEMRKMLDGYNKAIERATTKTRTEQAFLVAGTGIAIAGHFFPPLWLGALVVAPARYVVDKRLADDSWWFDTKPAAMFHEARQELARDPLA